MRSFGKFLLWTAIVLTVVGVLLRVFLIKIWTIPTDDKAMGASIAPSLSPGDIVILLHAGTPGFSDVVRCTDPDEPRRHVIGRIAAEGGDSIVIQEAHLRLNNKDVPTERACSPGTFTVVEPTSGNSVEIRCDIEDLGGHPHMRGHRSVDGFTPQPFEKQVQNGFVFLVSDNRSMPVDSRTYGALPTGTCDARIIFRIWGQKGFFDTASRFMWIH